MTGYERIRAITTSKVETSLRMVLVALVDHMSDTQETCWPSVETIAARAGLCERQARGLLADAEARGLIRRWVGDHKSRDIEIVWGALATATATLTARGGARGAAKTASPTGKDCPPTGKDCHAKTATPTGKDCYPNRQRLPDGYAKTAPEVTIEATSEATIEAECAPAATAGPRAPAPPKPVKLASGAYQLAVDAFTAEHRAMMGTSYPWVFHGNPHDGVRVKAWLAAARVDAEHPADGVERIRHAARAYLAAVQARTAWPIGEPAQTRHFTRDLARWLQTDPGARPAIELAARPRSRSDDRRESLAALDVALQRALEREHAERVRDHQEPPDAEAQHPGGRSAGAG